MLEHDELRKTLYAKAISIITTIGLNCRIGDEQFVVPKDGTIYGEFWFRTGRTRQMELGSRRGYECTPGILQFSLYAPEKLGEGDILRLGGRLKHFFNRQQYDVPPDGNVTIETMAVQMLPGIKNGHKCLVVDAAFDFYHRDPSAVDLFS